MKVVFFILWLISFMAWCFFAIRNEIKEMSIALIAMVLFNMLLHIVK